MVKGNVPGLTQEEVNKLARHKTSLVKLTEKVPIKKRESFLLRKVVDFSHFLLPLVASLIAKAVSKVA